MARTLQSSRVGDLGRAPAYLDGIHGISKVGYNISRTQTMHYSKEILSIFQKMSKVNDVKVVFLRFFWGIIFGFQVFDCLVHFT